MAELLVALLILAQIATFTIPKVLTAQQDSRFNAIAKETMGMISTAYTLYKYEHGGVVPTTMNARTLEGYFNRVKYVNSNTPDLIDREYGLSGTFGCYVSTPCLYLHNGAVIQPHGSHQFGGSASTNAVYFILDPDGKVTNGGSGTGPGKSLYIFLYYNGRVLNCGDQLPGTVTHMGPQLTCLTRDPPWFSWD